MEKKKERAREGICRFTVLMMTAGLLGSHTHAGKKKKYKVAPSLLREVDSFDQRMGKVRFS